MVGNMIRVLRARMTLLAVDEAGMSMDLGTRQEHESPCAVPCAVPSAQPL